jgi:Bacterial conjugation TrbI-like protein
MKSQSGWNGSLPAATDAITEPSANAPASPTAAGHATRPVTRTELRASQKFQQNRFVIVGAGALVIALLLFVAVSVPYKNASQRPTTGITGGPDKSPQSGSTSDGRSLLPITDSGRPTAKEMHDGFVDERDVQRTASKAQASSPAGHPGTLASVPPFPGQWQAPPYQPGSDAQMPDTGKAERDALEKSSLVYVRSLPAPQGNSSSQSATADPDPMIGLGMPTGTRLRARLESAVSTAVRTPVLAVIEYNYERAGEIIIPAGAKAIGRIQQADRSGYMTIQFDSLIMPDETSVAIQGVATDLSLRPPKGRVEGKNTGKNVLVRSLSGIGQVGSLLVGRANLNQPFSAGDMLRERVSNNIGQASDEQVSRFALTEHVVVTIPANTPIYVVLEKSANARTVSAGISGAPQPASSASVDELRQLLQLQRERQRERQPTAITEEK